MVVVSHFRSAQKSALAQMAPVWVIESIWGRPAGNMTLWALEIPWPGDLKGPGLSLQVASQLLGNVRFKIISCVLLLHQVIPYALLTPSSIG